MKPWLGAAAVLCSICACGGGSAALDGAGVARDLSEIAAARGARLEPRGCSAVGGSRVVLCRAEISAVDLALLRRALLLSPLGAARAPGPAFGKSRCLEGAPPGSAPLALVTSLPWIPRSHYRYLLLVVPAGGGEACIETEHGYG